MALLWPSVLLATVLGLRSDAFMLRLFTEALSGHDRGDTPSLLSVALRNTAGVLLVVGTVAGSNVGTVFVEEIVVTGGTTSVVLLKEVAVCCSGVACVIGVDVM